MSEAKYFCGKCGQEIKDTYTICPNCKSNLRAVGRNITLAVGEGAVDITGSLNVALTKAEQTTLEKVSSWLRERISELEFEGIEIGFPSGIKIKFVKCREDRN